MNPRSNEQIAAKKEFKIVVEKLYERAEVV